MSPTIMAGGVPGIFACLGAGLLSFVSPCVLPLIPGYLSFISGSSLTDIRDGSSRFRVLWRSLAFVLGFSLVFVVLGLVISGTALALGGMGKNVSIAAGILVCLLGLNMIFDFLTVLNLEARFHAFKAPRAFGGAFVLGLAFAAGWSPCVGPILAAVLLYAGREGNLAHSLILLSAYSLGLGLPFLAMGLFFDKMKPLSDFFKRNARAVRIVSGLLLLTLGAAMALGRLGLAGMAAARAGFAIKEAMVSHPGALRAAGAAFWALLSLAFFIPLVAARTRKAPSRGPQDEAGSKQGPRPSPARWALAAALGLAALAEAAGLFSSAAILASWLLFAGA